MKEEIQEALLELSTIRDFLRWSVSRFYAEDLFFGHGTDEAWDDALTLVLHALHLPPDSDARILDARLTQQEKQAVLALVQQRLEKRIPAPYLTHCAYFLHLAFYVDERVLIPRSPIAELIENRFSPWIDEFLVKNILDLGTGSGCIAIACALYFKDAQVLAIDKSPDALAVAKKNIESHHCDAQVSLLQSDVFAAFANPLTASFSFPALSLTQAFPAFDIIVSNPPYVSSEEMRTLPAEYRHEPQMALEAEDEGLAIVIRILKEAHQYLSDHGILVVEVGNSQAALCAHFPTIPFLWLEFERGGQGVFLLTKKQLQDFTLF